MRLSGAAGDKRPDGASERNPKVRESECSHRASSGTTTPAAEILLDAECFNFHLPNHGRLPERGAPAMIYRFLFRGVGLTSGRRRATSEAYRQMRG